MLALDPGLLARLAKGRQLALVSATNGKSTTTRLLAEALRSSGQSVVHNSTGANMAPGVVTALSQSPKAVLGALEVDEAHLPAIVRATRPRVVLLMNLSRDQLDRGAEVTLLARRWRGMLEQVSWPMSVVANADDPLVVWAVQPALKPVWVGAGQWWREDSVLCPACAHGLTRQDNHWSCQQCGLQRPAVTWQADSQGFWCPPSGSAALAKGGVQTASQRLPQRIVPNLRLPGRVNVGNAALALAAAAELGVDPQIGAPALQQVGDVDGRYISVPYQGRQVRLLLGKNPASWTELVDLVGRSGRELVVAINARGADGRDPSWLWDVPFEQLAGRHVHAAGERCYDLAVRLTVAGLSIVDVMADPLAAVVACPPGSQVDVVANYTAFQNLRARVVQ
jgi:UDP-N-acetylmuramyl tripeptide synthase